MSPKEKAEELIKKMDVTYYRKIKSRPESKGLPISMYGSQVEQCTLTCIDEVVSFGNQQGIREPMMYWVKVKAEVVKYFNNNHNNKV